MADLYSTPGKEPILVLEDGRARMLSHDRATELINFTMHNPRLSVPDMHYFCGALLHDRAVDQPLSLHELASLVDVGAIPVGQLPSTPVIKMMEHDHAKALCDQGALRLGSIDYYRKYDDAEIGDPTEGLFALAITDGTKTAVSKFRGGLNDWLFCTFAGDVDPATVTRMGYDTAVRIADVKAFSSLIATHLSSLSANYSSCKYVRDRAICGEVSSSINSQDFTDGPMADSLGNARAFLKHSRFSYQSEFRFSWKVAERSTDFIDIVCPELKPFVVKIAM